MMKHGMPSGWWGPDRTSPTPAAAEQESSYAAISVGAEASALLRGIGAHVRDIWPLVVIVIAADIAFVSLHIAHYTSIIFDLLPQGGWIEDERFRLDLERTYSEMFEHMMLVVAALSYASCWWITKQRVYAALSAIHLFIASDNFFTIHESLGGVLMPGRQVFGEMIAFALAAMLIVPGLLLYFWKASMDHRIFAAVGVLLICVLAGFAVVVDAVHRMLGELSWELNMILAFIEDGGELLAVSTLGVYAVLLFVRSRSVAQTGDTEPVASST